MGFTVRHEKLEWDLFVAEEKIGAFWYGCGQFWWCTLNGADAFLGKSFPPEITETTQMAEFVFEQYKNIKGSYQ